MKHTFTLCLALLCNALAYSQSIPLDSIFSRMEQQAMLYPSEKVYLHTDRSVYMAGDDVWLRAFRQSMFHFHQMKILIFLNL